MLGAMRPLFTRAGAAILVVAATMALAATARAAPAWISPVTFGPADESGAPEIAVAPDGEAIATWVGSGREGIQVSTRRPGQAWSASTTIAPVREEVEGPEIAVAAGKAVIVWSDNARTRSGAARVVLAATRLHPGRWGKPQNISAEKRWREEPEGREPQVTITRGGKATVIWTAGDEGHSTTSFIRSATQAAGGASWRAPVGLPGSIEGEAPQVGMTPSGETVAIWGAAYDEESGIEVAGRPVKGPWKRSGRLGFPGPFPQPQLAITSRGEAIGVWLKEPEDGIGAVLEVATRPPGGKWKVKALARKSYSASPSIVTEPGGRVRLVWIIGGLFGSATEVVSSTHSPGTGWTAPTGLAAEGLQIPQGGEPLIAVTPAGESIAVWQTGDQPGKASLIEEASKPLGGYWSEPTAIFTAPAGPRVGGLRLAVAPTGEAFALWQAYDGSRRVVMAATRPTAGST